MTDPRIKTLARNLIIYSCELKEGENFYRKHRAGAAAFKGTYTGGIQSRSYPSGFHKGQ